MAVAINRPRGRRKSPRNVVGAEGRGKGRSLALNAPTPPPTGHLNLGRLVRSIASRTTPEVTAALLEALQKVQAGVDVTALAAAISSGNFGLVEAAAGAGRLQAVLLGSDRLLNALKTSTGAMGQAGAGALSGALQIDMGFDLVNPNVTLYARQQVGDLVTRILPDVRESIRITTALANEVGLTPQNQAKVIRDMIGLPANWASAPFNFADELRAGRVNRSRLLQDPAISPKRRPSPETARVFQQLEKGIREGRHHDPAWVLGWQQKYTERLIHRRALNIARTETLRATHNGQRELWRQAVEKGYMPKTTRRMWIVTPDERLSYEHSLIPGLNHEGRGLDEPFVTPEGDFMDPPIRTNCRCSVALIFPDEDGNFPQVAEPIDPATVRKVQSDAPPEGMQAGAFPQAKYTRLEDSPEFPDIARKHEGAVYNTAPSNTEDEVLSSLARAQGFDGLPQLVSTEEMDKLVAQQGAVELFRGLPTEEYAQQFQTGALFSGRGVVGNGTYTSLDYSMASTYARNVEFGPSGAATQHGRVLRMVLRPGAKIGNHHEIMSMMAQELRDIDSRLARVREAHAQAQQAALTKLMQRTPPPSGDEIMRVYNAPTAHSAELSKLSAARDMLNDVGRYATMRGYDGMYHAVSESGREFLLLNRNAVIVQKQLITPDVY